MSSGGLEQCEHDRIIGNCMMCVVNTIGEEAWEFISKRAEHSKSVDEIVHDDLKRMYSTTNPVATVHECDDLLAEADRLTSEDRNDTYGPWIDNAATLAAFWSEYLGLTITPLQATDMLTLLKIMRLKFNPTHRDSRVDIAGYQKLAGSLLESNTTTEASSWSHQQPAQGENAPSSFGKQRSGVTNSPSTSPGTMPSQ